MKYLIYILIAINIFSAQFQLSSPRVKQGDFFAIWTEDKVEIKQVTSDFIRSKVVPFTIDGKTIMYIAAHYDNKQGSRDIVIEYLEDGIEKRAIYEIYLANKSFEKSEIFVDEKMEKKGTGSSRAKSIGSSQNARANPIPEPMWQGDFIYSAKGRLTTGFGYSRYVNGKLTNRHSGLDIANSIGTEVVASNRGKVVYSDYLTVTGHTIIIDHGANIFTGYAHMDSRKVEVGKVVEKGEKIGEIGNTGFSTGPHLHFTLSVGTTFVDPDLLINQNLGETILEVHN